MLDTLSERKFLFENMRVRVRCTDMDKYLLEALRLAGGSAVIARELGITTQAISQWLRPPARHVLTIERLSGVSRYRLRPDIYGDEPPVPPKRGNGRRPQEAVAA